jgi:hypothetical protein
MTCERFPRSDAFSKKQDTDAYTYTTQVSSKPNELPTGVWGTNGLVASHNTGYFKKALQFWKLI